MSSRAAWEIHPAAPGTCSPSSHRQPKPHLLTVNRLLGSVVFVSLQRWGPREMAPIPGLGVYTWLILQPFLWARSAPPDFHPTSQNGILTKNLQAGIGGIRISLLQA